MSVLRADLDWTRPRLRDEDANAETDGRSARRLRRHVDPWRAQDPDAIDRDEGVKVAASRLGRPLLLPRHKCNEIIRSSQSTNYLIAVSTKTFVQISIYFHKIVCAFSVWRALENQTR